MNALLTELAQDCRELLLADPGPAGRKRSRRVYHLFLPTLGLLTF